MGLTQQVKSFRFEFRFKVPTNDGSSSELTREQFIGETRASIDSLRAKAKETDDKSDD